MSTSLVKFFNRTTSNNGNKLFWDRAAVDGLPFRGPYAPVMPEEEFEARVVRVADARNGFFDVQNPEENRAFLQVVDACFNGWFQCVYIERFWNGTTKHYIEWVEYYLEDDTRTPFKTQGVMEVPNGQGHIALYPQQGAG